MKRNNTIILVGCHIDLACLERTLARNSDLGLEVIVIDTKEKEDNIHDLLKREPILIKPYDLITRVEDYNEYIITKPIDAIASRHKYPRKKNEW